MKGLPRRIPFRDGIGQVLATADPPAHALHRSTVFPELVATRMETLEPDVVDVATPPRRVRAWHAPLARIEARIVLTVLLERTATITLDSQHAPRWVDSLMVRRHEQLPVRLVAR